MPTRPIEELPAHILEAVTIVVGYFIALSLAYIAGRIASWAGFDHWIILIEAIVFVGSAAAVEQGLE
jgi:hypothetical protein